MPTSPQIDPPHGRTAEDRSRFVEPSLRPSEDDQFSPRRVCIGITFLVLGFVGIFFGGSDVLGQSLLIAGSILLVVSMFAFRAFRFTSRGSREDRDDRKLYGTPKT